jgi:hypothetical protein
MPFLTKLFDAVRKASRHCLELAELYDLGRIQPHLVWTPHDLDKQIDNRALHNSFPTNSL